MGLVCNCYWAMRLGRFQFSAPFNLVRTCEALLTFTASVSDQFNASACIPATIADSFLSPNCLDVAWVSAQPMSIRRISAG